jgi:integrase
LDGKISARDQAFVLLLACYGVRQGHVAALRLDDIDWRARRITFQPHKRGKAIQHEMMPAVAVTLARYLRDERPASESSCIFLRKHAPYYPVAPARVGGVVRKLFRRLGVQGPCGPHALRHAFATRLLRAGQPLKVIADLLGHRSLNSTCIYAKVDHPRLLEVAMDWPEVSP